MQRSERQLQLKSTSCMKLMPYGESILNRETVVYDMKYKLAQCKSATLYGTHNLKTVATQTGRPLVYNRRVETNVHKIISHHESYEQ
jgi:hypothetical protein